MSNFTAYQDRLATNLLQLFAHPENSEWYFIIFDTIVRSTLWLNRNKHVGNHFFVFYVSIVLNSFTAPLSRALPLLHCCGEDSCAARRAHGDVTFFDNLLRCSRSSSPKMHDKYFESPSFCCEYTHFFIQWAYHAICDSNNRKLTCF